MVSVLAYEVQSANLQLLGCFFEEGGEIFNAEGASKFDNKDSTSKKGNDRGKKSSSGNEMEAIAETPSPEEMRQTKIRGKSSHYREDLQWKIEGMRESYVVRLETMTKSNVKRSIFKEFEIRFSNLAELPDIRELFDHDWLGWMSESAGEYIPSMV
ncbi:hypothetical protein HAX54_029994 [Datura stramonium]|uniref:Uncharacterized protein n=1 Tax=Datura stramonium TaxID=4076 RepID=A0ABS8V900_DATST|nr:hypothetical protein [Datura stramonium]